MSSPPSPSVLTCDDSDRRSLTVSRSPDKWAGSRSSPRRTHSMLATTCAVVITDAPGATSQIPRTPVLCRKAGSESYTAAADLGVLSAFGLRRCEGETIRMTNSSHAWGECASTQALRSA